MLLNLRIADFPHLKKEDRKKLHKEIHKSAFPKTHEEGKVLAFEEVARIIAKDLSRG